MPDVAFVRELAAVPIGLAALYLIYRLATNFAEKTYALASNHMNALARAIERMTEAVDDLRDYLHAKDKDGN